MNRTLLGLCLMISTVVGAQEVRNPFSTLLRPRPPVLPPAESAPVAERSRSQPQTAPERPAFWKVEEIVQTEEGPYALLHSANQQVWVRVGAVEARWRVLEIGAGSVLLEDPEQQPVRLKLNSP
jgi:hypothetical protein